jgi:hypothetical protein
MIGLLQTILGLLTVASPAAAIYVSVPAAIPAGVDLALVDELDAGGIREIDRAAHLLEA